MKKFSSEFKTLAYIIEKSKRILLFAHSGSDSDTTGSTLALKEYLQELGKKADIGCFNPLPKFLEELTSKKFIFPDHLDFSSYDAVIACDSVERGFHKIADHFSLKQAIVLIDHHPDIKIQGDVNIVDSSYSSVCEIIYDFFIFNQIQFNKTVANHLMMGILGDTGNFQHSNTTSRVMEIASELMKKGASISKIVGAVFTNKKISTLKLWGKAFEKARINPENGMIATVLTKKDVEECASTMEDIAQVASVLNTVPGTKFSLILSERENDVIKGSLRSEDYKEVNVSEIAHRFGGGGHHLASGFEIKGKIVETKNGWKII